MDTWPLTGRACEREAIEEVLSAGGPERGLIIAGPAGVGKTRLGRAAAATAAENGWAVREVIGSAAAREIPLGAFAQWADGTFVEPSRLVSGVIDAVTADPAGRPVLVVADDAHQLDELSAFTLHELVARESAYVIATIRTGPAEPDAITALWKQQRCARLELQALSRKDTDQLLTAVLGGPLSTESADRIWNLTRGNALFLRQLIDHELRAGRITRLAGHHHWHETAGLPPSLIDIVGQQMGALSPAVQDVVDLVSIAEPLEPAHLDAVAAPEAVAEAQARGLITRSGAADPALRVAHPLFGEVQRTSSGPLRLRRLRGELAQVLAAAALHTQRLDPIRTGLLWLESDLAPERDLMTAAAWAAILRLDLALTARFAEAAVRAGAGMELALLRAQVLILLNRGADALELLESLDSDSVPDVFRAAILHLRATNLLWVLGDPERSWQLIDDALAAESGLTALTAQTVRAVQLATSGRPGEAVALTAGIDRNGLPPLAAMTVIWASTIAAGDAGRMDQAVELAAEGGTLAAAAPEITYQTVNLACFHVAALVLGGDVKQACAVAAETLNRQSDMPAITRSVATAIAGMAALYHGDLPTALDQLGSAVTDFDTPTTADGVSYNANGMSYQFLILHAEALARAGDADGAEAALALMERYRPRAWAYIESDRLLARAWVAAAAGNLSQARQTARSATQFARSHGQHAREVCCLQAELQFGTATTALAARAGELAAIVQGPRAAAVSRWALARESGDADTLLEVSAELMSMGDRIGAADAAAHAAVAFDRAGRPEAAATALRRAGRINAECAAATRAATDSSSTAFSQNTFGLAQSPPAANIN